MCLFGRDTSLPHLHALQEGTGLHKRRWDTTLDSPGGGDGAGVISVQNLAMDLKANASPSPLIVRAVDGSAVFRAMWLVASKNREGGCKG